MAINSAGGICPAIFRQDRIRDLALSAQQVPDDSFAVQSVSDRLAYLDVIQRRGAGIKSNDLDICADKLIDL